ncbi:MAG TPA: PadR family transcriptional regulator [Coleofasciculaceae cyanobacterium]
MYDRGRRSHHRPEGGHHYPEGRHREHSGHHRPEGGRGGSRFGNPGRAKRGEMRYVLLDALRDAPKHGYEIMKALEERSLGQYTSSPGTIYPTLQHLEDLGLVRADQDSDRRIYHLTEAGQTELDAHAEAVEAFWARLDRPDLSSLSQSELGFLQEELDYLSQTIWNGLRPAVAQNDPGMIRRVRLAVEQCRNEIRRIITEPGSAAENPEP